MMRFIQIPFDKTIRLAALFQSELPSQLKILRRNTIGHNRTQISAFSTAVHVADFVPDELIDDAKPLEKDTALQLALARLEGDFDKESMLSLSRFFRSRRPSVLSTGSLNLDVALGIGGLPKGRMVEIYGQEASGKSTLAFHIIKEAQKLGGYCAYLDAENALDPRLLKSVGVNTGDLLLVTPDSAENMLCIVDTLTRSGSVDVIVVDSVAALTPQSEIDLPLGSTERQTQSQIMTKALRKIHYSLCRSKTLIVFLNQIRSYVPSGAGFGRKGEVTCGGNGLKFYSAIRLRISRMKLLKIEDQINGLRVCVEVVKNKLAPAMKKAELEIEFGRGIRCESGVLELALELGLILKQGSSYIIEGNVLDNEPDAKRYLAENKEVLDKIIQDLRSRLFLNR